MRGISRLAEELLASQKRLLYGNRTPDFYTSLSSSSDAPVCTLQRSIIDVRGTGHHSIIHKEKSNKKQQCIKILLFHICMKLNMFRATHRPSSGA
jgi:hypothetical protein